jgi:16S rRNA (guanine966-N2)-methyltransferase
VVRIIGGHLRGSKLPVADVEGLRPSADRVRETVFNWLQQDIHGARVLDLFAGSGALGFEAHSRGAAHVLLIERDRHLAEALRTAAARLKVEGVQIRCANALAADSLEAGEGFDGAFIDPPFALGAWEEAVQRVLPVLRPQAWLYIESTLDGQPAMPPGWRRAREGCTREVRYALYRRGD